MTAWPLRSVLAADTHSTRPQDGFGSVRNNIMTWSVHLHLIHEIGPASCPWTLAYTSSLDYEDSLIHSCFPVSRYKSSLSPGGLSLIIIAHNCSNVSDQAGSALRTCTCLPPSAHKSSRVGWPISLRRWFRSRCHPCGWMELFLPNSEGITSEYPPLLNGTDGETVSALETREAKNFHLRIMPLGASIVEGYRSSDKTGFRKLLRQQLRWKGWKVNMVGTKNEGHNFADNVG
jgi:hypothetical protein